MTKFIDPHVARLRFIGLIAIRDSEILPGAGEGRFAGFVLQLRRVWEARLAEEVNQISSNKSTASYGNLLEPPSPQISDSRRADRKLLLTPQFVVPSRFNSITYGLRR